jgi:5'-nucleotidase
MGRFFGRIWNMEENITISNPEKLKKTKKLISQGGAEKFFVLSDFDRTLTTAFQNGKNIPSLLSILRDGNYLTPDYAEKAHSLYNKYHPIEIDLKIDKEEKKNKMHEWWSTHFDLLLKSGLNKKDLEKVVNSGKAKFRNGFSEFAYFLNKNDIPLLIISSSGLGGDATVMYLEKAGKLYKNIYIISNSYEWDESGKAIAIKQPIIHVMNKDGSIIKSLPIFNSIKNRKNILLLGDSLDDIDMLNGLDYENLIKISFLNENIESSLDKYKLYYDIIALNDSSMFFVNDLLKELIK